MIVVDKILEHSVVDIVNNDQAPTSFPLRKPRMQYFTCLSRRIISAFKLQLEDCISTALFKLRQALSGQTDDRLKMFVTILVGELNGKSGFPKSLSVEIGLVMIVEG